MSGVLSKCYFCLKFPTRTNGKKVNTAANIIATRKEDPDSFLTEKDIARNIYTSKALISNNLIINVCLNTLVNI